MASNHTSRYQLCQWAAEDAFLREEFNADNRRVEAALGGLADRATASEEQLARQIPPLQQNVYNLMLQDYYGGKETGFKRALLFDGLLNAGRVAGTEPGVDYDPSSKRLKVYSQGMQPFGTGFLMDAGVAGDAGNEMRYCVRLGWGTTWFETEMLLPFSAFGRLNAVTLRLALGVGSDIDRINVGVKLQRGTTVLATANPVTVTATQFTDFTLSFPGGVFLAPGSYTLLISNLSLKHYLRVVKGSLGGYELGANFDITPMHYTSGNATSVAADVGTPFTGARGWVRHVGGAVGLALRAGAGAFAAMTPTGTRQTVNLQGASCTESSFLLGVPPAAPSSLATAKLTLNTGGASCEVCDYGIIFL